MTLYYKIWQMFLQNGRTVLLQNATNVYFLLQMRQFYYIMRQLLQMTEMLLQKATFITKFDVYYKLRQFIPYGWYPPPSTVVNNTGKAWGTSRTSSCLFMCIILYVYVVFCLFKKIRSLKKSLNKSYVLWNNSQFEMFN